MAPHTMNRRAYGLLLAWTWHASTAGPMPAAPAAAVKPHEPGLILEAQDTRRGRSAVVQVPSPHFTLEADQSIHPQLGPNFQASWDGFLEIERAGSYRFFAPAKLIVNGEEVTERVIELPAGKVPFHMDYERAMNGPARVQVEWASDNWPREPIPHSAFSYRDRPVTVLTAFTMAEGRRLIHEHNCVACHEAAWPGARVLEGPDLSGAGARLKPGWIYRWLRNPSGFRQHTPMPSVPLTDQEAADITAYLATLRSMPAKPVPFVVEPSAGPAGEKLFQEIGCVACHGNGSHLLTGLASKMTEQGLLAFLLDPLAFRPEGLMPDMALKPDEARLIANHLLQSRMANYEGEPPNGNPDSGRQLVQSRGCVACHGILENEVRLQSPSRAKPLLGADLTQGCLAARPSGVAPNFRLEPAERMQITLFLRSPDLAESPLETFRQTTAELRCQACHELDKPAELLFDMSQTPPSLAQAGEKLRRSWIQSVLQEKARARPWLKVRMPHYAPTRTAPLIDAFAARCGAELGEGAAVEPPGAAELSAGAQLLGRGEGGLACVNCHDLRGQPGGSEMRGPELTSMHDRIRADWLARWLRDPGRIRPGTAMPAFFSELPASEAQRRIHLVLQALAAGSDLPELEGEHPDTEDYRVKVGELPVVMRTFIQDSSPRSIAVGLPGGHNFVYDAELCRLRYAWFGEFIDVRDVWTDRGGAQARILGGKYYAAPDRPTILVGDLDRTPKVHFMGYRQTKTMVECAHEADGVVVREGISAADDGSGITKRVWIGAHDKTVWVLPGDNGDAVVTSDKTPGANGLIELPPSQGEALEFQITPRPGVFVR